MRILGTVLAATAGAMLLSGCIAVGYGGIGAPAMGLIYTEVWGPIDAGGRVGAKEGQACAQSILGLVATGDASIKAAAKAGGITQINSVDHYTRNVMGIMGEFCTIVRGS
ncbi:MAG: hypothetical protein IH800_11265 [Myxococcales bacterium]|nr:hypothetical protein [Myxococcales bacterium]